MIINIRRRMWFHFLLVSLLVVFLNHPSRAQSCQSVQRIDAKDGVAYMGIVNVSEADSIGSSIYALLFLKSLIGADTTYSLTVGMNTVDTLRKARSIETLLQFGDGSQISKSNQPIEVTPMSAGLSMSLAEITLTLDEVRQLASKPLIAVVLTSGVAKVTRSTSESTKEVATCLPITW